MPSGMELVVILVIALLIFGKRLPDVARSMGKAIVEFKKGIRDVNTDIDEQTRLDSTSTKRIEPRTTETTVAQSRSALTEKSTTDA
ncbi:MAG: twin-arginine translocase TatA/TatE family subunit [Planctomycetes bacterium]|nr:twin-arginine translocase TatA/TatE family subunit [Planctomycetota bacterium]MBI3836147.1 twin-arginine translocase TatA/TatE family subunit [Planctomycetota bacterium]